jgi:hydroxypyruvate isomerase
VSPHRFSTSISLLFRELPIVERFAAARRAGFEGVEIQVLAEGDPAQMATAAKAAGIEVVLVNVGMGDYLGGGPGLSGVPGREQAFRAEFERSLAAARQLRARFVHLGPSRVPEGVSREACLASYRSNLDAALAMHAANRAEAELLIEPMNRVEATTALIGDIDAGADLLRDGYAGRIGLQFDVYHVAMNGHDVLDRYRAHRDLVRHVQFSDVPGRGEPGSGKLDFAALFRGLREAGYEGWLGAEYFARQPTPETLAWFEPYKQPA